MPLRAFYILSAASLVVILLLTGCVTSGPRSRYLAEIEPASITNLTAYREGNTLEIRYPLHGKGALAHASWIPEPRDEQDYHYRFAALTFEKQERAARKSVIHPENKVEVRSVKQWQLLLHEVFEGLVPAQPGHGVLLLVQNLELILFRDTGGKLNVVTLANKPQGISVDHTYSDSDFSREAIQLLERSISALDHDQNQFLFLTGEDPAFALVDLQQRLVVFFNYPADPEARPVQVPGWFALRAVNSLLLKSFVIAAIKNPFTLVTRGLWHFGSSGVTMLELGSASSDIPPPPVSSNEGMDLAEWEKRLDKMVSEKRYKGRVQLLINGDHYFPALIQSVEDAQRSVDVLVYIFDTDDYAIKIADILKERSSTARVRVLLDDMGSLFASEVARRSPFAPDFQPPGDIVSYLRSDSHVHVRTCANPWLTSDHRKCVIIDDREAYVGGMNIGSNYRYDWHDMMVGLTGPIVRRLEKDYRKAWAHAGPFGDLGYAWVSLFGRANPAKNAMTNGIDIRPLRTATGKLEIYHAQLEAIRRSKNYIYIENAYFCDSTILNELILARRRRVDVRVVIPAETDAGIMQINNLVMANEMIHNGIRVYAYPGMTHVKAAIYDGWACLGSANLEKMSLRVSQELDVAFSDPATVDRLKHDLFETDFARAREIKSPEPLSWVDSILKAFADQL